MPAFFSPGLSSAPALPCILSLITPLGEIDAGRALVLLQLPCADE